jgi:hypothetical protein
VIKLILPVVLISAFLSCTNSETPFTKVECIEDSIDYNPGYDNIYRPCRQFIFRAQYWDQDYNVISNQRIWMMATGKPWEMDEKQREIVFQYEYDDDEIERIKSFMINRSLIDREWTSWESTGFVESQSSIWLHPFRSNQYLFTEVAPFPMISYASLDVGYQWSGSINIYEGWGDWSESRVEHMYYVTDLISLETEIGDIKDCYHISSNATAPYGISTLDYWFNMEYGIVKMVYRNYADQLLQIELIQVVED